MMPASGTIGCTLKEDQPLRIVQLITRTALYSVSKETREKCCHNALHERTNCLNQKFTFNKI